MNNKICGIYGYYDTLKKQIVYIGQSIDCIQRNKQHYETYRYNEQNINRVLQNDNINRYIFKIIKKCNKEKLNEEEIYFIKKYQPRFNYTIGGYGCGYGKNHINYGRKRPDIVQKNKINNPMHNPMIVKKMSINRKNKCIGTDNPNSKYTLWDSHHTIYNISNMFHNNRIPNPCKCFFVSYNGYRLPIGGFCDFITCDILNIFINKNKK